MHTIREALNLILQHSRYPGTAIIPLEHTLYRVLAEDILADRDYPPFNRSAMDGYALRSGDLKDSNSLKLVYELRAGDHFEPRLQPGECIGITTGAPVPADADTVVRVEDAASAGSRVTFSVAPVRGGQNIAFRGEDIRAQDVLLLKGTSITAPRQAALAMTGHTGVAVSRLPSVAIYSTGNEVQPVRKNGPPHHIRDSNSYALRGLLQSYAIHTPVHDPVPDDPAALKRAFRKGMQADILIISGGVSRGAADYVPGVLEALDIQPLFHRVRIKPGNPLWVGVTPAKNIVFALPGNPVAVQTAFKVFIEPFIRSCLGMPPLRPYYFPMNIPRRKRTAFDEYFPVVLHGVDKHTRVHPVAYNGSGDGIAAAHADGLALHPAGRETLEQQEEVAFYPWHHWF
ncbi:molybdopterin molybdotransferase MoeA [Compostibacter hankyongensis]|uniref:Molybdopterin molybdenumtransferase n=1 Tax=Compostibacter hankyongensis TaxID=1007089 RepID=A0ABP8FL75_9BACT